MNKPTLKTIPEIRQLINLFNRYRLFKDCILDLDIYLTEYSKNDVNRIKVACQRRDLEVLKRLRNEMGVKYRERLELKAQGPRLISIHQIIKPSFRGFNKKHIRTNHDAINVKRKGDFYEPIDKNDREILYSALKQNVPLITIREL